MLPGAHPQALAPLRRHLSRLAPTQACVRLQLSGELLQGLVLRCGGWGWPGKGPGAATAGRRRPPPTLQSVDPPSLSQRPPLRSALSLE